MSITFYYGAGSPFTWRVWLALEHKGLSYELKTLSFSAGDTRKPDFIKINPRHHVPVIVDDGFVLYESAAIIEYLEDQYPAKSRERALFPADIRERATVRRLIREIDQYFAFGVQRITGQLLRKPEAEWDINKLAAGAELCVTELAYFEQEMRGEFLAGKLSAADFTLYPLLALVLRLEKKRPNLGVGAAVGESIASWARRIEALPYFKTTYPAHWK